MKPFTVCKARQNWADIFRIDTRMLHLSWWTFTVDLLKEGKSKTLKLPYVNLKFWGYLFYFMAYEIGFCNNYKLIP